MVNVDKIITLAKDKGIKKSFICEKLGLARVYLNDVKKNNSDIPQERLLKIAEILGTTTAYLRDETDNPALHGVSNEPTRRQKEDDIRSEMDDMTPDELAKLKEYVKFIKSQRKE